MAQAGISTLLVVAAPFLLPRLYPYLIRFLSPPPPNSTRTPLTPASPPSSRYPSRPPSPPLPPASTSHHLFRLLLATISISTCLFIALLPAPSQNLFLSLAPPLTPLQRLLPAFRTPLDLRTPSEHLAASYQSILLRTPLTDQTLTLLNSLNSLDSRLLYFHHGPTPLLTCTWCSKPHSTDLTQIASDYFLATLPAIAINYLAVVGVLAVLLREVRGTREGREYARKWIVGAVGVAFAWEVYKRMKFEGISGGKVVMLHTHLHLLRHLLFTFLLLLSSLLPSHPLPSSSPRQNLTTVQFFTPKLHGLAQRVELVRERIRAAGLMRMAGLHDGGMRDKITQFWQQAEEESSIAHADPILFTLARDEPGEHGEEEQKRKEEEVMRKRIEMSLRGVGPMVEGQGGSGVVENGVGNGHAQGQG